MKTAALSTMLISGLAILLFIVGIALSACGDKNDGGDDDDSGDGDIFDPIDHVDEAYQAAQAIVDWDFEVFALPQIDGAASPDDVDLDQKDFVWTYTFQVIVDPNNHDSGFTVIEVTLEPEQKAEVLCDGDYFDCAIFQRWFLTADEFDVVTMGLAEMVAFAIPLADFDVRTVTIYKDLDPAHQYIGYYLLDESGLPQLMINAETGQIGE